jgi:hypothetical protein
MNEGQSQGKVRRKIGSRRCDLSSIVMTGYYGSPRNQLRSRRRFSEHDDVFDLSFERIIV